MIRARIVAVAAVLIAAATGPAAQQAGSVEHAYRLQFENEWVKVVRVHYEPHERLGEHPHPGGPNIYVYLNDGGPVLFKHEHGDSGGMAATRPPTKARAYRLAAARHETHIVENQSDLPNDFLQVGLKTDINLRTFAGRHESDLTPGIRATRVEFDTDQIRVTRATCAATIGCEPFVSAYPALWIALSAIEFDGLFGSPSLTAHVGEIRWIDSGATATYRNHSTVVAEYLLVEFKGRPTGTRDR